jgi:hypothetical protein
MTIKGFAGASKPPIYDQHLYVQEEERLMTLKTTLDVSHKRLDLQCAPFLLLYVSLSLSKAWRSTGKTFLLQCDAIPSFPN